MENVLITAGLTTAFGLLLLVLVWPDRKAAAKLLRRWGVARPTEPDVTEALRYLRRRRFWYPPLYLGLPFLDWWLHVLPADNSASLVVATLVIGGLLAELLAQRTPKHPQREALLTRRGIADLVPWWALATFTVVVVAAAVRLVLLHSWSSLGLTAAAVVATAAIVVLAVRRPVSGTVEVDLALRLRSARVAVALGIVIAAAAARLPSGGWSLALGIAAIVVAWFVVAPLKRVPVPA